MNFVMNEEEYAKALLEKKCGIDSKNRTFAVIVVAKYYRNLGYNDADVERNVKLFISESFYNASKKSVDFWISRAMAASKKYPLFKIDGITVTDKEMELIKSLNSDKFKTEKLQRLAFAFLCFSKFEAARGRKDGWVNIERKYIFRAADLKTVKNEYQLRYVHELHKLGYVDIGLKIGLGGIKVLGNSDGLPAVIINDINEVGYVFEEHEGRRFARCRICGKMVPVTNGRNIYCRDCAIDVDREKAKERMRKALVY